jgi:hypothetical protein
MKNFDLKSLIAGVLLTMLVVSFTLIATADNPRPWDYKLVQGFMGNNYESNINAAAKDGWEVVSAGFDAQHGPFAVMRRQVQRSARWKFWKK